MYHNRYIDACMVVSTHTSYAAEAKRQISAGQKETASARLPRNRRTRIRITCYTQQHSRTHAYTQAARDPSIRRSVKLLCFFSPCPPSFSLPLSRCRSFGLCDASNSNSSEHQLKSPIQCEYCISVRWNSTFSSSLDFHSASRVRVFAVHMCLYV